MTVPHLHVCTSFCAAIMTNPPTVTPFGQLDRGHLSRESKNGLARFDGAEAESRQPCDNFAYGIKAGVPIEHARGFFRLI